MSGDEDCVIVGGCRGTPFDCGRDTPVQLGATRLEL
jgi:hypothetical protein